MRLVVEVSNSHAERAGPLGQKATRGLNKIQYLYLALGILTFVHYSHKNKPKNQNKLIKNKDPMALCTYSKDSPGISHVQAHAHTHKQMHTHTPHTPWETVKG